MKTAQNLLFIFCFVCLTPRYYSQDRNSFSLESGTLYNCILNQNASPNDYRYGSFFSPGYVAGGCFGDPNPPNFEISGSDAENNSYRYGRQYEFHNTTGYFVKAAFQKRVFSKNKFSFLIPFGISYFHKIDDYSVRQYSFGSAGNYDYQSNYRFAYQSLNLSLGVLLQKSSGPYNFNLACFYNLLSNIKTAFSYDDNIGNRSRYTEKNNVFFGYGYLSSQASMGYYITRSLSIGPSVEIFFRGARSAFRKGWTPYYYSNYTGYILDLKGNNLWINSGLKLQIDL